jgi:hypothetical protein
MLLFGFITRTISLNIYKTAGIWFSGREVVIANGIISTGFGMGFTLGAMIMEIEGVGASYAGTAIGLIWTFGALGNFITPPLGNSLASIDPGFPFIFWGSLVIVPLLTLRFVREKESQLFNPTKPVLCLIGERESGPTAKLEG